MDKAAGIAAATFLSLSALCLDMTALQLTPLDIGGFQPDKHWHDMAIQDALLEFNTKYCYKF